jgi:hypothetical protein
VTCVCDEMVFALEGVASGMALYQVYLLRTADGEIVRLFEVGCANDQEAVLEGARLRGAAEVEIEVWERTRFVCRLPVRPQTSAPWQQTAKLVARVALSSGFASLGTTFIRWSIEALSWP